MKKLTETGLVGACLAYLRLRRVVSWRINSGAVVGEYKGKRRFVQFNGAKGCSDILGLLPPSGRFLAIECKMPRKKLRSDQEVFLAAIRAAGGLALVVHDVAELDSALKPFLEKA